MTAPFLRRCWILVLGAAVVATGCADSLFYFPSRRDYGATPVGRDVFFRAPDGPRLHGVWIDARGARRGAVVYCHGNNRNLSHHARWISWLADYGYDVLVFDYRGYGRSEGVPTRAGLAADAGAAIDLALRAAPGRVVVWGRSLGAAAAMPAVAAREEVRGLVLEGGFARWHSVAQRRIPWLSPLVPLLVSDGPDPVDEPVGALPVLILHGDRDGVVAVREAGEVFEGLQSRGRAARTRLVVFGGAGHRTVWDARANEFETLVTSFLEDELGRDLNARSGPGDPASSGNPEMSWNGESRAFPRD